MAAAETNDYIALLTSRACGRFQSYPATENAQPVSGFLSDRSRDIIAMVGLILAVLQMVLALAAHRRQPPARDVAGRSVVGPGVLSVLWAGRANVARVLRLRGGLALLCVLLEFLWLMREADFRVLFVIIIVRNVFIAACAFSVEKVVSAHNPRLSNQFFVLLVSTSALIELGLAAVFLLAPELPFWAQVLVVLELFCYFGPIVLLLVGYLFLLLDDWGK